MLKDARLMAIVQFFASTKHLCTVCKTCKEPYLRDHANADANMASIHLFSQQR